MLRHYKCLSNIVRCNEIVHAWRSSADDGVNILLVGTYNDAFAHETDSLRHIGSFHVTVKIKL